MPVLELGDPAGPPVVLLPGLTDGLAPVTEPGARAAFADVPLPLERFRALVLSHRHPLSAGVTTRQLAADAAAAMDQLLDRPATLVCHSMGGMVAQHLCVERSDLVAGLVLSATLARADEAFRAVLARWEALVVARRFGDFVRDAVASSFTGPERERRLAELAADPPPDPPAALVPRHVALTAAGGSHDAAARLAGIHRPTLLLAGDHDEVVAVRHAHELAAGIPGARLEVLAGLGHGFPEQDPDGFTARVLPFLQEVAG